MTSNAKQLMVTAAALMLAGGAATIASAAENTRSAGAHEHGRGVLNIAIEGNKVEIELDASGDDLLGFEHAAKTQAEHGAIAALRDKLKDPLALFVLPPAAGCKLVSAEVDLVDDDGAAGSGGAAKAKDGKDHAGHAHAGHDHKDSAHGPYAEIEAEYGLTCAAPEALTSIEFVYFKAFPRVRTLNVTVVGGKGQGAFTATPSEPVVKLSGLM